MKLNGWAKFAWIVLIYNVLVVAWGVFLRASKSGDGCGKYWLTCHGEVIPSAPQFKTVIEFSHRVMSGVDFFVVLALLIGVLVYFRGRGQLRTFAILSFVFIVTEALIGAGLVLTGNVAESYTASRPFWAIGHLINTFLLLGSLTVTAWLLTSGSIVRFPKDRKIRGLAIAGTIGIVFVGITGAIASLTNMLFPSESLMEAVSKDFDPNSNILLRLRILHPVGSIAVSVFLAFTAALLKKAHENKKRVGRFADTLSILIVTQVAFGAVTLLTGAPILMQLVHLLLADAVWIVWVLVLLWCFEEPVD